MYYAAKVPLVEFDLHLPPGFLDLSKVLFVDFDGVLHPEGSDKDSLFCFSANFAEVMEQVDPEGVLTIVVSSAWRLDTTLPELRSHFNDRLHRQIVGVTPQTRSKPRLGWDCDSRSGPQSEDGDRLEEVKRWMRTYSPAGDWLALDDRENLFYKGCPNLFRVPEAFVELGGGLNTFQCERLKERLVEFLGK